MDIKEIKFVNKRKVQILLEMSIEELKFVTKTDVYSNKLMLERAIEEKLLKIKP